MVLHNNDRLDWVGLSEQEEGKVESIVLTVEILEKGLSRNGGYSSKQLKLLSIKGFPKGWKKDLIGRSFPHELINEFIKLKDKHLQA